MTDPEQRGQAEIKQIERAILRVGISVESHRMIGASQNALSIQNPSQAGPRTQGDGNDTVLAVAAGSAPSAKTVLAMVAFVGQLSPIDGINFRIRLFNQTVKSNVNGLLPSIGLTTATIMRKRCLHQFYAFSCSARMRINFHFAIYDAPPRDDRKSHPFSLNRPTAFKFLNE